jgi:diguanylate cyclase (GGDEF)-like protein/PAS domain S-box-containing protein
MNSYGDGFGRPGRDVHEAFAGYMHGCTDPIVAVTTGTARPVILWANPAAERLLGWAAADLLEQDIDRITAEPGSLHALLHTQRAQTSPVTLITAGHSVREVTVTVLPTTAGVVMLRFDSTGCHDTSANDERFRVLAQCSPIATFVSEAGLRLAHVNDRFADLFGAPVEQLTGSGWILFVHPDDLDGVTGALQDVLAGTAVQHQARIVTAAGDERVVLLRADPVRIARHGIGFVGTVEDVTDRLAVQDALARAARHDALTGLPNRVALAELLEDAAGSDNLALLFLDLDNFKVVNDSLGHAVGDELLAVVARRLATAVRTGDVVCRLGGDEFVIAAHNVTDDDTARNLAMRLLEVLAEPVTLAGVLIRPGCSIGVVRTDGTGDGAGLLGDADVAMYQAKAAGKGRYALLDDAARKAARDRLLLVTDLSGALENRQLFVVFQPVVSMTTHQLTSVEALVRWNHPQRGPVSPAVFVPLAEDHGLIRDLTLFVMETACAQAASWYAEFGALAPVVNINLSAALLNDLGLVDYIAGLLTRHRLPASKLCIELTESAVMRDVTASLTTLHGLRGLGVALAIDDFGTGYSSLGALRQLPVSYLKVDRSFVAELGVDAADPKAGAVAGAVVSLAQALHMETVAEGVEHLGQVEVLTRLGCTNAQGFHFSKPVPAETVTALLTSGPERPVLPAATSPEGAA